MASEKMVHLEHCLEKYRGVLPGPVLTELQVCQHVKAVYCTIQERPASKKLRVTFISALFVSAEARNHFFVFLMFFFYVGLQFEVKLFHTLYLFIFFSNLAELHCVFVQHDMLLVNGGRHCIQSGPFIRMSFRQNVFLEKSDLPIDLFTCCALFVYYPSYVKPRRR